MDIKVPVGTRPRWKNNLLTDVRQAGLNNVQAVDRQSWGKKVELAKDCIRCSRANRGRRKLKRTLN